MTRPFQQQPGPVRNPSSKPSVPKPLSPAELVQAQEARAVVHARFPELLPMIKEMQQMGLIDGWRSVTIKQREKNEST